MNEYVDLIWDRNEKAHRVFLENLAPIVLFTYNRPDHARRTIDALKTNIYAAESRVFIYSDAPKNPEHVDAVRAVREYLHTVDGFKKVEIIERKENWGLARNIVDGVTKAVNEYGKVIVLEDDIATSKYFLKYLNDALEIYKKNERVMAVGSYCSMCADDKPKMEETFFLKDFYCWGWATWKTAWSHFDRSPDKIRDSFKKQEIYEFSLEGTRPDIWGQVLANCDGSICTWAVFWAAAIFKQNGLVLYSKRDMSGNIGDDGSGVHHSASNECGFLLAEQPISKFSKNITLSIQAREASKKYFLKRQKKSRFLYRIWIGFKKNGFRWLLKKSIIKINKLK